MSLPRDLVGQVRRLSPPQLRRLLILARGLLLGDEGPVLELADVPGVPAVTYRRQAVRCGKGCAGCPHGPYWYAHWKEGGRSRSQYIGGALPPEIARMVAAAADADDEGHDPAVATVIALRPVGEGGTGRAGRAAPD